MDKTYTSYNNSSKATVLPTMKTTTRKTKSQLAQSGRGWPGTSEFMCCHGLEDNRDDWRVFGDGGSKSNGAIFDSNKFKMAAAVRICYEEKCGLGLLKKYCSNVV